MKQNIYDNAKFFETYKKLRDEDTGINGAIEVPAMRQLIGEIKNKVVLDLDFKILSIEEPEPLKTALADRPDLSVHNERPPN
ncbi:MAG: hypothetical protein AAGJ93_03840 [Bacteroidota bacterium]